MNVAGKTKTRKTNPKKQKKAQWMWLEQVYFRFDAIEKRLDALEETAKFISDEIQKLQDSDKNGHKEKS
jgi:hypothetical protein